MDGQSDFRSESRPLRFIYWQIIRITRGTRTMPPFPLPPPFPANESLVSSYAVVNARGGNERRGEERRVVVGDAKGIFFFFLAFNFTID